jgi:hypothetical protein
MAASTWDRKDQKEEIDLRDRTKDFALRVRRMFSTLPKTAEAQVFGKQVLRSGTSVGQIVSADKLAALRTESDELTAIFVTILKRSKDPSSFFVLPSAFL